MKNKIFLVIIAFFALTLQSCLKDEMQALDPSRGHNVLEFKNFTIPVSAATDKYVTYIPKTLENIPSDEFESGITWAGPEEYAPEDIVIQLEANPAAATEAGYDPLASGLYEFPSSVTLKKGEHFTQFKIKVYPDKFDGDLDNALALTIKSASFGTISGNIGTVIYSLPVKNPYDGVYRYQSAPTQTLLPNQDVEVELRTISGTRSRLAPGLVGYYSNQVDYIVDKATNQVTVEMTTLLPIATDPASIYDPATRTFHLKWTSGGGNRYFEETLTYIKARD